MNKEIPTHPYSYPFDLSADVFSFSQKKNEREKPRQPEVLLNITTSRGF